jgi:hypothetical protein
MGKVHQDQLKELERRYLVLSSVIDIALNNAIKRERDNQYQKGVWVRLTDVLSILKDVAMRPVGYGNMEEIIEEYTRKL